MAQEKVRKRKFASKLKSGCRTCKRRRIKCDEERPKCSRCRSSGRRCDGYEVIRIANANTTTTGNVSLIWSQPSPLQPDVSLNEMLAFKYFQYSCGSMVNDEFKYRPLFEYILQAAHVELPVWHATVALGSLQRPANAPTDGHGPAFSFHQYGKALKILNDSLSVVGSETILASSLLLATFEVVQKEFKKGSQHINGSLNYMCDLVQHNTKDGGVVFASLVDVFARLAISSSIFGGLQTKLSLDPFEWLGTHIDDTYHFTLDTAGHAVLFSLAAMRMLEASWQNEQAPNSDQDSTTDELLIQRDLLLNSIELWQQGIIQIASCLLDPAERNRATLLQVYMKYCEISVCSLPIMGLDTTELRYDNFIVEFQELLDLCKTFMKFGEPEIHEQGGLRYPSFTIHIGIIHILWYIAIKCRQPLIRREALQLLNHCHHGEGDTFDGVMIAGYAEMVIQLEEGEQKIGHAADVSLERRICKPYFNTIRDDHVLHCEKGDFRLGEEWTRSQPICVFSV